MQELLQSWALSSGTTMSCSVSELWAVGGRHGDEGPQSKATEHKARSRMTEQQEKRWLEASETESQRGKPRVGAVDPG